MTLSFMIRKKHLEEKVREQEKKGTFIERREYKSFWRSRIGSVYQWGPRLAPNHADAVFLCGRHAWRADVLNVKIENTPKEIKDIISSKVCYAVECRFDIDELEWLQARFPDKVV